MNKVCVALSAFSCLLTVTFSPLSKAETTPKDDSACQQMLTDAVKLIVVSDQVMKRENISIEAATKANAAAALALAKLKVFEVMRCHPPENEAVNKK